ncbi:MAG: RraA family protein [Thaumarchaeota archaeon]|nr:RraA family protein [Nitrososphaerota archaeon]
MYSAVISDILDEVGVRNHTLSHHIRPIRADMVLAGRAMPIVSSKVFEIHDDPYKLSIEVLDSLRPNEVPVIVTNNDSTTAMWGELFSTASRARGARGTIIEGFSRDTRKIMEMDYPLFCTGTMPTDSKGRAEFIKYGHQVRCGDVIIKPGDVVFADLDGVVAIPKELEREVLDQAYKKVGKEGAVRIELLNGALLGEAWRKHGVL